jgi:hypothetical protein
MVGAGVLAMLPDILTNDTMRFPLKLRRAPGAMATPMTTCAPARAQIHPMSQAAIASNQVTDKVCIDGLLTE